uniref:GTPase IMAP family member 8-like n=1 Tax=Stegastes partitus TaxID=144197 RepID=A0A3B4Z3W7_9TELE
MVSELRVVLLGGSWSDRSSLGNIILGETAFSQTSKSFLRSSGPVEDNKVAVINSPDLLFPTIDKETEFIRGCEEQSAPGPHVFLLVVQSEDFTEEHSLRLQRVLGNYNDRSFDHSLLLILKPREDRPGLTEKHMEKAPLRGLIRKCRYRYLMGKNLERAELLTRFGQIVKENNGEHVSYEAYKDTTKTLEGGYQSPQHKKTPRSSITAAVKAAGLHEQIPPQLSSSQMSAFRIVLLGKSEDKKTRLGNLIIGHQGFHQQTHPATRHCVAMCGEWEGKPLTVVKTPDMFSLSEEMMRKEVKSCVSLCSPGPDVLLLLVKPSDFTEGNRETLKFILSLFGEDAFKHSMVVMTHDSEIK